ncbi:MAG: hypothetical protein ACOY9Y_02335 [Bacillota bacterium]
MSDAFEKALMIAAIGLPVMLGIIGLFILLAKALVALFPHQTPRPALTIVSTEHHQKSENVKGYTKVPSSG